MDRYNSIIPFHVSPSELGRYSMLPSSLIRYSKVLWCYASTNKRIEYASIHLLIPTRIPESTLRRLTPLELHIPPYLILSYPHIASILYDQRYDNKARMNRRCTSLNTLKSWEAVHNYMHSLTSAYNAIIDSTDPTIWKADTPEYNNAYMLRQRTGKYLRIARSEIRKALRGKDSELLDNEYIQSHIQSLDRLIPKIYTNFERFRPFAELKLEATEGNE